ncbi:unnamed protein product [Malus baccata var. baccata]
MNLYFSALNVHFILILLRSKDGSHLRNAEEKQTSDDENASKSIEEFLGIARDLEDIVDTFVLGRTRRRRSAHHNLWKEMMQIEERISTWKLKMVKPHPFENNNDDTNNPKSQAAASSSNCPNQQHNDQVQVHLLDELPSHLKPCLLHLGMFPREMDIPIRRLFHLGLQKIFWSKDLDTIRKLYQVPQKPKKVGSHRPLKCSRIRPLRSTQDDEMARPSSIHLVSLVGLKNLTKHYLLGKLANLDKYPLEFPPSLRDLTLSCSRLNVDPMLMLRRLPHLAVLRLLANSYSGSKMVSQQSEFGSLRILQLWVLEDLEEWVVEQGAMQNLQKLEIRRCHKLKSVLETLINSTTLEELTLTNMPEEFVAETQILSFKTNTWKLIIR